MILESGKSTITIEDSTGLYFESVLTSMPPENRKAILEVAFRKAIRKSLETAAETVYSIIDAAIVAMKKGNLIARLLMDSLVGLVDPALPFLVIEEWMEIIPVWQLDQVFSYVESRMSFLSEVF